MQDQASAEASAQKVAAELLAEEEQAAVRAAAKKAKKLRQKQAKKQPPQAAKPHSGPAEHLVPKDVPAHDADESEQVGGLLGEIHAGYTDTAPPAAERSWSETSPQDTPPSKSAAVSKACIKEEPEECSRTTSTHSEADVTNGAEASCENTAAAAAAAAALSACSLAQSPETGLAPSGSCAAKASDVESSAQHADAIFLKNLFCCPITRVSHCSRPCTTGSFTDARKHGHVGCHQCLGPVIFPLLCTSLPSPTDIASLHQVWRTVQAFVCAYIQQVVMLVAERNGGPSDSCRWAHL